MKKFNNHGIMTNQCFAIHSELLNITKKVFTLKKFIREPYTARGLFIVLF